MNKSILKSRHCGVQAKSPLTNITSGLTFFVPLQEGQIRWSALRKHRRQSSSNRAVDSWQLDIMSSKWMGECVVGDGTNTLNTFRSVLYLLQFRHTEGWKRERRQYLVKYFILFKLTKAWEHWNVTHSTYTHCIHLGADLAIFQLQQTSSLRLITHITQTHFFAPFKIIYIKYIYITYNIYVPPTHL